MEFWIKSIGAAREPLGDEWLVERGADRESSGLAERVHFPRNKRPVGINVGDYFLLYAVTDRGGRIVGAGVFRSDFYEEEAAERHQDWPWRIDIDLLISVWHAHRGPTIDAIDLDPVKMRRRSHLRLSEEQYLAGIDALAAIARPVTR
jgi:hypothetical protein